MTSLQTLLDHYRTTAATNRESGTYFEELTACYLRTEPAYQELYGDVLTYAQWAEREGLDKRDAGIDLVAITRDGEVHAIQCKLYAADYKVQKADIDSFFTASGKKPFARRLLFATTDVWSEHAEAALRDQQIPVTKIDRAALEASVIDWAKFAPTSAPILRAKKQPRPHQRDAASAAAAGLSRHDRGRLIMACGTGKTFTSLKIAEASAGAGKAVLFLVPSLALLSQTLTEWTQESEIPLRSFAVCSDSDVGKRRSKKSKEEDDGVQTLVHELQYPATTEAHRLAAAVAKASSSDHMIVVFATYHSIEVLHQAQLKHGLPRFDLIVCDEAHRTTGATFDGEDESPFVRIHDDLYVGGSKRLYMTATPRIFGEGARIIAERENAVLCSMDDEELYGPRLYTLSFSDAVKRDLLVDYKVIVLAVDEAHVSRRLQHLLADEDNQLRLDDASKIVGCWKALAKEGLAEKLAGDDAPMRRAVAFCQVIERQRSGTHKVSSKEISEIFKAVVDAYRDSAEEEGTSELRCEAAHVDGGMNASTKEAKITWLKEQPDGTAPTCRILTNVRCLSEGVDVPALDAVLFLTPRNSQIDVVQSVGRVMRKAPGKQRGYIILPVVIPAGIEPHDALNDNQTYRVVWQVLQALRSHDDRFDAMVNKIELDARDPSKMEVIAVTDRIARRSGTKGDAGTELTKRAKGARGVGRAPTPSVPPAQRDLEFKSGEVERAIYAKLVEKVGNRHHWEDWAKDIAKIAQTHITRITTILENPANVRERQAFEHFAEEIRDDLNDSVTRDEVIEMLAQHLVTRPVFDALFAGQSFVAQNSMSRAMESVLLALQEHHLEKESSTLEAFYESVKLRATGVESAAGRQKIIIELYDKFFRNAFPKMAERLGIVYTPVEIVDFILKSVDHLLRTEFGQNLGSEGVHIIDPFVGTGTFITRLLQSGLIDKKDLPRKYATEIHANEIVLLAYYIAAVNIESAYHDVVGGGYAPFEGICLTDTFQLYEKDDVISRVLVDNSNRRKRQKALDIRVILGNPPYSVGQDNENDNNANIPYPRLDQRIAETYAERSSAKLSKGLYDSYVRALRWASDRIGSSGIVGFVTNASFVDAGTFDGLRKCLADEFANLYIVHLRGNARTAGERRRKEGGNVFDAGSRAPVAISLLVKRKVAAQSGIIHVYEVADYVTREDKLKLIATFGSIVGVASASAWTQVSPDDHGDWLKQRDENFGSHTPLGSKDKKSEATRIFDIQSLGVVTNRDAWATNSSTRELSANLQRMLEVYDAELKRFSVPLTEEAFDANVLADSARISWTRALKKDFLRGTRIQFDAGKIVRSLYRPYCAQWLYFDRKLNEMVYQMPRLFPAGVANLVIGVSASESRSGFSALMTNLVPSLHATDMVGSQYFPFYVYDTTEAEDVAEVEPTPTDDFPLFARAKQTRTPARRDGITDAGLAHFESAYPGEKITKEDLFYYVYGILHSPDYRERYADNLGKELPRIPRVRSAADFWAFSKAGRALGELHVHYEKVPEYPAKVEGPEFPTAAQLRVEKMKFGKGKDKTTVVYNAYFTVRGIPLEAYEYVVNGKSAVEWVMERQSVTTDKASGIVEDANAWATETVGDPRYPLSLLLRVVTVGIESMKVVRSLPALDLLDGGDATPVPEPKVSPLRRITPAASERYKTAVPLVELRAAAGSWSASQEGIQEVDDSDVAWVTWEGQRPVQSGHFVAQVVGQSMEPLIPDGAYCLFRRVDLPSSPERAVLVRHAGPADPETGGQYTLKHYRMSADGAVTLKPVNPTYEPIVLTPADADEVRVIAEVVEVIG